MRAHSCSLNFSYEGRLRRGARPCKLGKRGLKAEAEWIEAHRKLFGPRFEALDEITSEVKREESDERAS